jgi:hypothetical protein
MEYKFICLLTSCIQQRTSARVQHITTQNKMLLLLDQYNLHPSLVKWMLILTLFSLTAVNIFISTNLTVSQHHREEGILQPHITTEVFNASSTSAIFSLPTNNFNQNLLDLSVQTRISTISNNTLVQPLSSSDVKSESTRSFGDLHVLSGNSVGDLSRTIEDDANQRAMTEIALSDPNRILPTTTRTDKVRLLSSNLSLSTAYSSNSLFHTQSIEMVQQSAANNGTLALLFPPGLFGGYRNQVIRLMTLCVEAKKMGVDQILLPSLLWRTQIEADGLFSRFVHLPMEMVFDIDYWNSFAPHDVPKLVPATVLKRPDCWDDNDWNAQAPNASSLHDLQHASLKQGGIPQLQNASISYLLQETHTATHKQDLTPSVQHCRNPKVHGGGFLSGKLWSMYNKYRKNDKDPFPYDMDHHVFKALKPLQVWEDVAAQCIEYHVGNKSYAALHARVEIEMLMHKCGKDMERHLQRILDMTAEFSAQYSNISGLFVAVSRVGMESKDVYRTAKFIQRLAKNNADTLDHYVGTAVRPSNLLGSNRLRVFECGKKALSQYYSTHPQVADHGLLLESVLNFHIAVQADVFIGVAKSSYSTDVLTTRYLLGKGRHNFLYTKDGIVPVENGGLPPPHKDC